MTYFYSATGKTPVADHATLTEIRSVMGHFERGYQNEPRKQRTPSRSSRTQINYLAH